MNGKIVITGMGAVTPIGLNVDEYWKNICLGKTGIGIIEKIDTDRLNIHEAGEVKGFFPKDFLSAKLAKDLEPYMQYAYVAAEEAIRSSGLNVASDRVGIVMCTALAGIGTIEKTAEGFQQKKMANPKYTIKAMGNIASAYLSINYGIRGPGMTVSTACSSGGDAISLASMMIKTGMADAIVVMGGEAAITPSILQSLWLSGALSKTGKSKPFDLQRDGFVVGEGGGSLILESEEQAKRRNARIYAELLGISNTLDAYNPVSPDPEGRGAARCMEQALSMAGITAEKIGYINVHGTATLMGDIAESKAIHQVFSHQVFVSSTKGATGHMMGAGGLTELISCIKAINEGILPLNVGCETEDPKCGLNLVTKDNNRHQIKYAMSNSLGFGGQNSSVIIGSFLS